MKTNRNRDPRKKGFTLVEIMIVVVIIGLLCAIAIPNFVKARNTAQTNACINNLRQIDGAKNQWALETGQLDNATPANSDITPYIKLNKNSSIPPCPAKGTYSLRDMTTSPTCTVANHVLP